MIFFKKKKKKERKLHAEATTWLPVFASQIHLASVGFKCQKIRIIRIRICIRIKH
jgi:hypothetical protein